MIEQDSATTQHHHDSVCSDYPVVCAAYNPNEAAISSCEIDEEFIQTHGLYSSGNREGAENMSSTVTDNTDSVTFQWSNRVSIVLFTRTVRV